MLWGFFLIPPDSGGWFLRSLSRAVGSAEPKALGHLSEPWGPLLVWPFALSVQRGRCGEKMLRSVLVHTGHVS